MVGRRVGLRLPELVAVEARGHAMTTDATTRARSDLHKRCEHGVLGYDPCGRCAALELRAALDRVQALEAALRKVGDLIEDYEDVEDSGTGPRLSRAMCARQVIAAALAPRQEPTP